jgi:superfamily II DNA or RNA helicase
MKIREKRQREFAKTFDEKGRHGILNLCPRFGKIRTTIHILEDYYLKGCRALIAYPDNQIKDSWKADFEELKYDDLNVQYTTHLSLDKYTHVKYDIVIIDEIHLLSEAQIEVCKQLFENNTDVLGLTGTLARNTEITLEKELDIHVLAEYPIEKAIEEGVITDYEIKVIRVPLDNVTKQAFGKKFKTEKEQYRALSWVVDKITFSGGDSMFMRLARMRLIQNSLSKLNKTKEILMKYPDDRILVFCGTVKSADSLGIPSFHNKSKDKDVFTRFAEGEGKHLAVVKIGNTGTTYKPLNRVIINYFDSNAENLAQKINRCMAMEYNTPNKKALIYIISTDEKVELAWLKKALEFFDETKIRYI